MVLSIFTDLDLSVRGMKMLFSSQTWLWFYSSLQRSMLMSYSYAYWFHSTAIKVVAG